MVVRKGYMFSSKKHSIMGLISTVLGIISAVMLGAILYLSFQRAGNAGVFVGIIGFISIMTTIWGLIIGIRSFFEEDMYYLTSKLGTGINTLVILAWVYIIIIGN